jgi:dihydrofolate reductase
MRKLKLIEHMSLDGVIQHSGEDDFPYSDWTAPYRTPAGRDLVLALQGERFDLLLGRRTYDLWSGFWPKAPGSPMADRLNAARKYVVTHRPQSLEWGPFEGIGPDVVEGVRGIKAKDGADLILWGSSTLTSTLLEHGFADEVLLLVYPVLLGKGKRFFAEGTPPRALALDSTQALPSGIVINSYKAAGPLQNQRYDAPQTSFMMLGGARPPTLLGRCRTNDHRPATGARERHAIESDGLVDQARDLRTSERGRALHVNRTALATGPLQQFRRIRQFLSMIEEQLNAVRARADSKNALVPVIVG